MLKRFITALGVGVMSIVGIPSLSHAQPAPVASIERTAMLTEQRTDVEVFSPAMQRVVRVQVLHPVGDGPRPTLYLLDGVSAGEESEFRESTWTQRTDIEEFVADKNVNVVLPIGGTASYYTDWRNPDPVLGVNKWETFLTQELPQLIDARFHGNGVNAVAGLSMGATGAMSLITRHPDLYRGVAALSGCFDTSRESSRDSVRGTVAYKGGNPDNMWGPPGDPVWAEHDSYLLAERLRGKEIFLSTGNGLVGPYDFGSGEEVLTGGTPLEIGTLACTVTFDRRLRQLDIPAQVVYRPWGTHSWAYWQDDIKTAWPTLKAALQL
ncbi:esterase family protein [Rhodococcus sp. BL-253-APC-6A1W]|uniref:alpha/beta hydrolase n=1 Tax=Rhodococcus sp. BL-253-APC-6A1W TaxID=2725307 RepID=UPI00146E6A84|nr:alpha/beta hydrolase family protein [Rhodococcus sp. BL-253-APC-6A1W]NMD95442.1 esterase family protein [Rhodococcus sp. BL-253-APC-6A1W]